MVRGRKRKLVCSSILREPFLAASPSVYDVKIVSLRWLIPGANTPSALPAACTTKYVYDMAGNLRTRTDQLLRTTTYDYDLGRRLVKQTDPLGRFVTHRYDVAGRRTQTVDAVANQAANPALGTTTYTYDRLGRTVGRAYSDGTPAVSYNYDTQGRRTSMTDGTGTSTFGFDPANRMVSVTDGAGTLLTYTYDANNNVLSVTDPFNGTTTRTVDNVGRITSVSANEGAPTEYVYDPAGLLTRIVTPDSHEQRREYDSAGRLTTMFEGTQQVRRRYAYAFDPSNNITSITASGWAGSDWSVTPINPESRQFLYDAAGRLRRECVTAGTCTTANSTLWTYDQIGRRLTEKKGSAPVVTNTYDAADQLVSATNGTTSTTYGYNANGDQTVAGNVTSTFNTAHQTKTVTTTSGSVTYGYDGDGNRVTGGSSRYVWDRLSPTGVPDAIAELNGTTVVNRYRFGPLGPAVMTLNGNTAWPVVDHVGTIRQLIQYGATVAQYTSDAWGNRTTIGTPAPGFTTNPLGYTGQYSDPLTGNLHLRARQYNPGLGTFTQTDPLAPDPDKSYPSAYVYGNNNPVLYSDPTGLRAGVAPWTGVQSIPRRDWGGFDLRLFISSGATGGWLAGSAGDKRGFSASATCAESRACVNFDFAAGLVTAEVNYSCSEDKSECSNPSPANRIEVTDYGSTVRFRYSIVNPRAPKIGLVIGARAPAIDGTWTFKSVAGPQIGSPGQRTNQDSVEAKFEGDAYPSQELYARTSSGVPHAMIRLNQTTEKLGVPSGLTPFWPNKTASATVRKVR